MEKLETEEGGPTLQSNSEAGLLSNICSGQARQALRKEAVFIASHFPWWASVGTDVDVCPLIQLLFFN